MLQTVTSKSIRIDSDETVDAEIWPEGSLEVLSQVEVDQLRNQGEGVFTPSQALHSGGAEFRGQY